jgi:hypothetical protein
MADTKTMVGNHGPLRARGDDVFPCDGSGRARKAAEPAAAGDGA